MMAATSCPAAVMSSPRSVFSSSSSSQVVSIVTLLFLFGSARVTVVDGVNQCVICDASFDNVKKGISCEKKPPLPEPCPSYSSSKDPVYCMKVTEYDANDVILRFARGCTTLKNESGCTTPNSPQDIKLGFPAKSCFYRCETDGCDTGNGIHHIVDVLLVSCLLTTMLSIFLRV